MTYFIKHFKVTTGKIKFLVTAPYHKTKLEAEKIDSS